MSYTYLRATLFVAAAAFAFNTTAAQRTFVATSGSDANTASNCSNTAPCRGFAAALTVTDTGGEIIVLSSGGYGPVVITKSVSIIAPEGIYAGISVSSGDGVSIAAVGGNVVLRGLSINNLGGADNGISMTVGNSLVVQDCVISNFTTGYGVYVSGPVQVQLLDTILRGNEIGAGFYTGPQVLVSRSRFLNSLVYGLYAYSASAGVVTRVEVGRSEASGTGDTAFYVFGFGSGRVELNVKDSVASRNAHGVYAIASAGTVLAMVSNNLVSGNSVNGLYASGSGAKLVATGNKVSHNGTGLGQSSSAVLQSTGDNTVTDNTTATSGTITSLANM